MSDDIKPDVVRKTQESLGKHIKKPPLTEKLLKKPPFRFLHDVITNVIRETGFLEGVFTPDELNHENVKDRESKINFLQKAIDVVKSITGIQLTARPSKIVAGHEPAKTNEFLQAIGKALEKKLDSSEYAAKPSKPEKIGKSKSSNKEEGSKVKSKSSNQVKSHSRDKSKSKDSTKKKTSGVSNDKTSKTSKETDHEETKKSEVEVPAASVITNNNKTKFEDEQQISSSPHPPAISTIDPETVPPISNSTSPKILQSHAKQLDEKEHKNEIKDDTSVNNVVSASPKKTLERKKKSAKVHDAPVEVIKDANAADTDRKETATPIEIGVFGSKTMGSDISETLTAQRITSARPRTARPASARPAAPRVRDRGEVVIQEEPRVAVGKVNVITDSDSVKEQDEFENFVVEETPLIASLDQESPAPVLAPTSGDQGQQGHLVAQILETQKELEDDTQFSFGDKDKHSKRVEIEWESGQRREKEIASKEVDRLRTSIQTLTRAANPLGKLMDFLQEDVDAMQRELEQWKTTNEQLQVELHGEQSLTEESVEPMKIHLQRLQQSITEKLDEISALKAKVLRNDIKIEKLVTGGILQKSDVFA